MDGPVDWAQPIVQPIQSNEEEKKEEAAWRDSIYQVQRPLLVESQEEIEPIIVHGRLQCDVKINGDKDNVVNRKYKTKYWIEGP